MSGAAEQRTSESEQLDDHLTVIQLSKFYDSVND